VSARLRVKKGLSLRAKRSNLWPYVSRLLRRFTPGTDTEPTVPSRAVMSAVGKLVGAFLSNRVRFGPLKIDGSGARGFLMFIRISFFTRNSILGTGWGRSFAADDAEPSRHSAQESPSPDISQILWRMRIISDVSTRACHRPCSTG